MPGSGRQFGAGNQAGKGFGRPKGSGRIQICKEWAEKKGFKKLIDLAEGKYEQDGKLKAAGWAPNPVRPASLVWVGPTAELQFEALKLVLAYGAGKPTESLDLTSGGETLSDWALQYFGAINSNGADPDHRPLNGDNGNGNGGSDSGLRGVPDEGTP
jgi:hypothetical protein